MNSSARSFGMMAKAIRSVSAPLTESNGVPWRCPSILTKGGDPTLMCRSDARCSIR